MNLCSLDSRLKTVDLETDARRDMFQLQTQCNLRIIRRQLEIYLWRGVMHPSKDRRKADVPSWFFNALLGLMNMFQVNEDDASRIKFPERFDGVWRETTRKELEHCLCPKSGGILTRHLVTTFLRKLENCGIITRDHSYDPSTQTKKMYLRFHADRLITIVKDEFPRARMADCRVKVQVKSTSENSEFLNGSPMPLNQPSYINSVQEDTAKLSGPPVSSDRIKEASPEPPVPGVHLLLDSEKISETKVIYSGDDAVTVKVDPDVLSMVELLKRQFSVKDMTDKTLALIKRRMRDPRSASRLTFDRFLKYTTFVNANAPTSDIAGYTELEPFLKYWPSIWRKTYAETHIMPLIDAQDIVEACRPELVAVALKNATLRFWARQERSGPHINTFLDSAMPDLNVEEPIYFEVIRFAVAADRGRLYKAKALHGARFRKLLRNDPLLFAELSKTLPIREWSGLENFQIQQMNDLIVEATRTARMTIKICNVISCPG